MQRKTIEDQAVVLAAVAGPAAAGSGWTLLGHGLVSADWLAGPCCKIPAPGTHTQAERDTAAAAVRLQGKKS